MNTQHPLGDALRSHADEIGDAHPLTLDDVKGRARGIRRRRIAVSGLAAAAVLAVAVPLGATLTDRLALSPESVEGPPASGGGTLTPDATAPEPLTSVELRLTTDAPTSDALPGIDYLQGREIVRPDGSTVPVDEEYAELAAFADGWVAGRADEQGDWSVDVLASDGSATATYPAVAGLAVSADGSVVAFGTPDGALMTLTEGDEPRELFRAAGSVLSPVAVVGSQSCEPDAPGGGCTVFYDDQTRGVGGSATSAGEGGQLDGLKTIGGVAADGRVTGRISVAEDLSTCSALLGADGQRVWETCDHSLGRISPDGRYVLGHPSVGDGLGDSSVAVLDAETGTVLVSAVNDAQSQAFALDPVWDADGSVLMMVTQQGEWHLMRLTVTGELTTLTPEGVEAELPDESPVAFATQP